MSSTYREVSRIPLVVGGIYGQGNTVQRVSGILDIRNVSYAIGGKPVLRDVSLSVGEGETVVLLGRSGSGKTTLLKTVNGLVQPDAGEIWFLGKRAADQDP